MSNDYGKITMEKSLLRDMYHVAVVNTTIAVFGAAVNIFLLKQPVFTSLFQQFVFVQIIGFTIFTVLGVSRVDTIKNTGIKTVLSLAIFIGSGWLGIIFCFGIFRFFIQFPFIEQMKINMIPSTIFLVFLGVLITNYETLRTKLTETAAKLTEKELSEQNILRLKTKAELEALRAKVNPHFLFNTLNSIASLIPRDPQKAEEMVLKLSGLFRYTLDVSMHDLIKLSEEIHIIREYLEIEKVRLGDRLRYSIHMDIHLTEMMIPGLLLQPLVENSVKHGISVKQGGGEISIRCFRKDENCRIEITDTCGEFDTSFSEDGFGLYGVRERLDLLYGDKHTLEISSDRGVKITIDLPLSEHGEPEK